MAKGKEKEKEPLNQPLGDVRSAKITNPRGLGAGAENNG